ncbi:glycosyltransferase family 1 protein [Chenggangzhangella methanolivorans]|uniref:Glycosyltransferase family 1 protein n=1 Tax=Chenggangzhangella methanolivorans TaxID=1437009 RepID=A0A9E6RJ52_9HYPH|nr:glycosyltransferase family 1 protein [Chenggangzhangella methanolivorans]QZO01957.1 glycosyltransferase family 1 protein [Chenggangzhangella methanolivorans]
MTRTVLDVTRLLTRAGHPVATGVDRVELAYARRALAQEAARVGFAAIVGRRAAPLPREDVAAFVAALDAKWRRGRAGGTATGRLEARLGATFPETADAPPAPPGKDEALSRALRLRLKAMTSLRKPAVAAGERYLHVSHIRLDQPEVFERIASAGARLSILVHDLIPIRFPEYGRPGEDARHRRRMTTAIRTASTLIANSAETARDLAAFAQEIGAASPPAVTGLLGIEAGFSAGAPALAAAKPYFVALGTIEPRKNHLLLLHLWRRLAERLGADAPTLVVVGRRGWENEMVVDLLERSPAIRAHVVEANDLPDAALAALVKGARALLFSELRGRLRAAARRSARARGAGARERSAGLP